MIGACDFCRREIQAAWGYSEEFATDLWCCSRQCLDLAYAARKAENGEFDMTENEKKALLHAGSVAGAYLDKIGKTDLGEMEEEEWEIFLEAILETYTEELNKIANKEAPF